jgi:hypothetical protein
MQNMRSCGRVRGHPRTAALHMMGVAQDLGLSKEGWLQAGGGDKQDTPRPWDVLDWRPVNLNVVGQYDIPTRSRVGPPTYP